MWRGWDRIGGGFVDDEKLDGFCEDRLSSPTVRHRIQLEGRDLLR